MFLLQHLLPQAVGTTFHDRLCHGLIATTPLLSTLLCLCTSNIVEHHLKKAIRHTLEKLIVDVCLIENDVCLPRVHAQCLHESLLVLVTGGDGRELE